VAGVEDRLLDLEVQLRSAGHLRDDFRQDGVVRLGIAAARADLLRVAKVVRVHPRCGREHLEMGAGAGAERKSDDNNRYQPQLVFHGRVLSMNDGQRARP
jgi:hypothetical protein